MPSRLPIATVQLTLPNYGLMEDAFAGFNTTKPLVPGALLNRRKNKLARAGYNGLNVSLTILVVEDEPIICFAMEQTLQSAGFKIVTAPNGDAALALLTDTQMCFAGLIADIRLGQGIDGWSLARQARARIPEIAVIYTTGDSAADWAAQRVENSLIMQKPVADEQLLAGLSTLFNELESRLSCHR